ncbi:hypothetical protein Xkoz_01501 [Xenorhabdus kozodoii]|uniref:HTH lysR-type domain-containing protein n=1 Tax=Xenorhabdus kozodoii TaxID=351676 RepID=A0A2D0LDE8_9GAMM|nr:hypothetical protein Xkoz_01501 [Xenorhabdus kozodoii]
MYRYYENPSYLNISYHGNHILNNYKLLPALLSILQTLNLTESSKQLGVTQSAMSKILHQLREDFHDKIIVREANQFILTRKGEKLKKKLPALMQQLENLYTNRLSRCVLYLPA